MAEINDIDLKLNIIADDKASTVLKSLSGVLDTLRTSLAAFKDINPFAQMAADADALGLKLTDLKTRFESLREATSGVNGSNPFGQMAMELSDAYQQASRFEGVLASIQGRMAGQGDMFTPWQTDLSDVSGLVVDISGEVITVGDDVDAVNFARWSEPLPALLSDLGKAETQLAVIQNTTKEIAISMSSMGAEALGGLGGVAGAGTAAGGASESSKGIPSWLKGVRGASGLLSELPMKALYGGMNMMMGYYGLQSLANGTQGFASIQQMKNLNNSSVNQAAQYQMMLGAAGLTGTSGVSFLQGLAGNMQKEFTPSVGSGALSQSAILLESLGITKQDTAQSPMMLLSTIGQRYRQLISQGRGSQASELMSLTGTSSVGTLMQNWGSIQKQASQTKLNMTPKQLDQAAQQNVSMQMSMQQLNLAFEQMAITLVPLVSKLTGALTALMNGFDKGKGPVNDFVSGIVGAAKHLGVLGTTIVGAVAAIKAASFTSDILSGAGVIGEVGGGITLGKILGKSGKGIFNFGKKLFGVGGKAAAGAGEAAAGAGEAAAVGGEAAAGGVGVGIEAAGTAMDATVLGAPVGVVLNVIGGLVIGLTLLSGHFKQIGQFATAAAQKLGSWASDAGSAVSNFAQQAGQHINSWATTSSNAFYTFVGQTGTDIATWTTHLVKWSGGLWTSVSGDFSSWTTSLVSWSSKNWSAVSGEFSSWTTSLVGWSSKNWSAVSGQFSTWTSLLAGWASKNWGAVTGDFAKWTQSLQSWASKNWPAVQKDFAQWTSSLRAWASRLWGDVQSDFSKWTLNLGSWANQLWPGVQNYFSAFTNSIVSWASSIVTDIDNILNGIKSAASQIVSGTKNMIGSLGSWINSTATSIGKSVTSFFGGSSSVPSSLSKSSASFVNTVRPYAQQVSKATGMPMNGLIGQWAYETGWGTSTAAKQNANLGGIIPFGQYGAGQDSSYAGFNNLAQFAQADISVLNQSRYSGARNLAKSGASVQSIYAALSKEGYDTTNPGIYSGNVASIANQIPKLADGGMVTSPTLALVGEAGPEMVIPMNRYPVRAGAVNPLGATGTEGGGTTFNVVINVPGLGTGPAQVRQLAEMVATEFKNQVKRRGNFDWS